MTEAVVLTERRGNILVVTINRPRARNACNGDVAIQMEAAMNLLEDDPTLFLGILTGSNGVFSAGSDLKAGARGEGKSASTNARGPYGLIRRPPAKPLIAAVEGFALGGGLELCLACDLIVAARDARMGLPEVRHGVVAIYGGLFRLPKRIPYHVAMELALTGTPKEASFFYQHGLINRLVEPGMALQEALVWAEQLLENGPLALAVSAQIIRQSSDWADAEAWQQQTPLTTKATDSADAREGILAFVEKRRPRWVGA
ncbi:crotonase/enoyl-CoA hydratase family protein [Pseudomonas sp. PLMAX]|uniref:crotonase/enoyl-CoA hydratase family protein n=1 Tax=Pseudomonas sp. PLMAX TaxID=2201998 RepID=UPI0038B83E40